jgi:hypothetical protein
VSAFSALSDALTSNLSEAMSSFWNSGNDTGRMKSPFRRTSQEGGAGRDARDFVQGLLKDAKYIRFENDQAGKPLADMYGRSLAYAIIGTPKGEINVQAELIRSGFAVDWQAFGPSATYASVFAQAQREAQSGHRGPMWGGNPPAPIQYQPPAPEYASRTQHNVLPSAAALVDADTFNLGPMFGEIRLLGVNAPEMTSWEGIDTGTYFSPEERIRSRGHGDVKIGKQDTWKWLHGDIARMAMPMRKPRWYERRMMRNLGEDLSVPDHVPSWKAVRKSFPTNPGQFEGIKGHPEAGFPGGREQPFDDPLAGNLRPAPGISGNRTHIWTIDIEAQDIRTGSFSKGAGYKGRGAEIPIGISQFAVMKRTPDGVRSEMSTFTDLVDKAMLDRHGIKGTDLIAGKQLPKALVDELIAVREVVGTDVPHWARSLGQSGSIVDRVFRRHAQHVLEGKLTTSQHALYGGIIDEWKAMKAAGDAVEIRSWNVSYDFVELLKEMKRFGFGDDVEDLLKSRTIRGREMMQSVQAMQFDAMMADASYVPVMTDRAAIDAAVGLRLKEITLADAKRLGMIRQHTGLRGLVDDIKSRSRVGFDQKVEKWLAANRYGDEVRPVIENLWSNYSQVTDWDSLLGFTRGMQERSGTPVLGTLSEYQIFGQIYGMPDAEHVNVLGSVSSGGADAFAERMVQGPLAGQVTGFNFTLGNKLEDVGSFLIDHQKELQISSERAEMIKQALGQHEGGIDTAHAEAILEEISRIRADRQLTSIYHQKLVNETEIRGATRINQLYQDALSAGMDQVEQRGAVAAAARKGAGAADRALGRMPNWATWALGASALWLISENNKTEKEPNKIEGMRRSDSVYNSIAGIIPSDLPYSNISAFHSGYDTFRVMSTTAPMGDPARPMPVSQAEVMGSGGGGSYVLPQPQLGSRSVPMIPDGRPAYGMPFGTMSDATEAGILASMIGMGGPMVPGMRVTDAANSQIAIVSGNASPARQYLLETFNAMGSGEEVDIGGEIARIPLGYSGAAAGRFRAVGYAGYVQRLSEDAMGSRIRDHATQLRRLPGMPTTSVGGDAISGSSHAEALAFAEMGAE